MADELTITLAFETPPSADELGELFSALARDYRDMTKGRVLVVTQIETGSLIATLKDYALLALPYVENAVEVAIGIKAVADLAKLLKDWLNRVKEGSATKKLYRRGRKSLGQRSVESIVKIAARTGSAVHIKHTTAEGETLEVELSSLQAIKVRNETLAEKPLQIQTKAAAQALTEPQLAAPGIEQALGHYDVNVDHMSSLEAQAIIDALVEALHVAGLIYLANQIADDLANRGLTTLSAALRARIDTSEGKLEPPLTTT